MCFHHQCRQAGARSVEVALQLLGSVLGSVDSGASSLLGSVGSSVSSLLGGVGSSVSGLASSLTSGFSSLAGSGSGFSGGSSSVSSGSGRSFSSRSGCFHGRSGGSSRSFFLLAASSQSSSSDHGSQNERLLHDSIPLEDELFGMPHRRVPCGPCRLGATHMPARGTHAQACTDLNAPSKASVYRVCIFFKKIFAFPVNRCSAPASGPQQLPQHIGQDAAVAVVVHLDGGVDAQFDNHRLLAAVRKCDH